MSKLTMELKVVSPERIMFDDDVFEVVLNTQQGQITVLPRHIPLISILIPGEMIVRRQKEGSDEVEEIPLVVSGGFIEVAFNKMTILADTAEHIKELDIDRAEKAIELAESLLQKKKYDIKEYESLQFNLNKNKARVSAFTKWRK